MRRVILAIASTVAGLVLLLTFKTHSTSGASTPPAAISTPAPASGGGTAGAGTVAGARTVTGAAASTIYGPVQVQITVKRAKVTAARAVEYPEETPRDTQINAYAIPVLDREAVSTGGAKVDMVSGATYTSRGYVTSLQSALDQARA